MSYKITNIEVIPMNKYDYNEKYNPGIQHKENKWKNGYCCTVKDEQFWVSKEKFEKLFTKD